SGYCFPKADFTRSIAASSSRWRSSIRSAVIVAYVILVCARFASVSIVFFRLKTEVSGFTTAVASGFTTPVASGLSRTIQQRFIQKAGERRHLPEDVEKPAIKRGSRGGKCRQFATSQKLSEFQVFG